jgi:hypothetical protein
MGTRCIDGRLMRHDPQPDDPNLETDIGKCPECDGEGCEAMGDLQELWEDVSEAVSVAINNGDGCVYAGSLQRAFMKAGLSVFRGS